MRLSAEQVKCAIGHSDRDVRSAAARYFADAFSSDPGLMPLVIAAIERWGWGEAFDGGSFLRELVQSDESVAWLLEQIKGCAPGDPDDELPHYHAVCAMLARADASVLARRESEILKHDSLDDEIKKTIAERISLLTRSSEEIWQELEEICHRGDEAGELPADFDSAGHLVEALGRDPEFSAPRALALLSDDSDESEKWLEVFGVRLAGDLRLAEAVPQIVAMLPDADDWIFEEGQRALIKIGGDAVVEQLAQLYPTGDFGFRLASAAVFRSIHTDLSVETCLRLVTLEQEQANRNWLMTSALANFSSEAIAPAREFILSVRPDPEVIEVRNDLLTVCKAIGERFPEFDAWVEAAKHDQEFREHWYRSLVRSVEAPLDDEQAYEPPPAPTTIFREEMRVGRNDTCPCGSGKKFKKCCLKDRRVVS